MFLSAIVVAEFCIRQKFETLPLEQLILLPFTHEDAVVAASFDFKPLLRPGNDRQSLKDDVKIIGHAHARDLGYPITEDAGNDVRALRGAANERTHPRSGD
jgi:hypothetical protein